MSTTKKTKTEVKGFMYDVITSPVITEKSQIGAELNKYVFNVSPDANRRDVKASIEALFGVKVVKVNILMRKGKVKRFRGTLGKRKDVKKAIVTLKEGDSIDVVAGL